MKVGVISDTHDRLPTFRRAIAMFKRLRVEAIFHAGDFVAPFAARLVAPDSLGLPLYCIYGNNDGERVEQIDPEIFHFANGLEGPVSSARLPAAIRGLHERQCAKWQRIDREAAIMERLRKGETTLDIYGWS